MSITDRYKRLAFLKIVLVFQKLPYTVFSKKSRWKTGLNIGIKNKNSV